MVDGAPVPSDRATCVERRVGAADDASSGDALPPWPACLGSAIGVTSWPGGEHVLVLGEDRGGDAEEAELGAQATTITPSPPA